MQNVQFIFPDISRIVTAFNENPLLQQPDYISSGITETIRTIAINRFANRSLTEANYLVQLHLLANDLITGEDGFSGSPIQNNLKDCHPFLVKQILHSVNDTLISCAEKLIIEKESIKRINVHEAVEKSNGLSYMAYTIAIAILLYGFSKYLR